MKLEYIAGMHSVYGKWYTIFKFGMTQNLRLTKSQEYCPHQIMQYLILKCNGQNFLKCCKILS